MSAFIRCAARCVTATLVLATSAHAQSTPAQTSPAAPPAPLVCASEPGGRQVCAGDTSAGVALVQSTGTGTCLLGKTWGYDDAGVWVADGCSGEFQLGRTVAEAAQPVTSPSPPAKKEYVPVEQWGEFTPGAGFLIGRTDVGELAISGYALARYMNQMPATQTFVDHLGNTRTVDGRNDIFSHRIMIFLKGWVGLPRLQYALVLWTVNATDQRALFATIGYQFRPWLNVYTGLNGNPGTRSLQGSHPFWLGTDRVMADEFFRPFFGSGAWVQGQIARGLWYNVALMNNSSALATTATELDRIFTRGASVWWQPTTGEFGPRGGYGDWEMHDKVATRFGASYVSSPEQRFGDPPGAPDNTTIRLADSVNVFDTGALAPNVTVNRVDYRLFSMDAGMKYRGIFLQTEIYNRWLDHFLTDGPLPVGSIHDTGYYVQAAFYPVPKKLEVYSATSQIFGDKGGGFQNSSEYLAGANFYPANTRNHRVNVQVIDVNRSPVSSTFGYYVGGQTGTTVSVALSVFF